VAEAQNSGSGERFRVRCEAGDDNRFRVTIESLPRTVGQRVLRESALENMRFTDKTNLGPAFNAKTKLTYASLNDASDGNFELVKEYEVPS
jgi:hypothetical protein